MIVLLLLAFAAAASVLLQERALRGVSQQLDCAIRLNVWKQSVKLIEWSNLTSFDALKLGVLCNVTRPRITTPSVLPLEPQPMTAVNFFVSTNGSDTTGDGSLSKPFRSPAGALAHLRGFRAMHPQQRWSAAITMFGGEYFLREPIVLTEADSFTTFTRFFNDEVILSGGTPLSLTWQQMSANIYVAPCQMQSFTTLFVNNARAIRARVPNGNPETTGIDNWFDDPRDWMTPRKAPAATEIHIAQPSRPNTYFPEFEIGINGAADNFDPPESYWALASPSGGGAATYRLPRGLYANESSLPNSISQLSSAVVHAMQGDYWGSWMFKVDNYSQTNGTTTISFGAGGWQEARGADTGGRWFLENLIELLDSDNEWYFDEVSKQLYFYSSQDPSSWNFTATTLEQLVSIDGSQSSPVVNVTLCGLTLTATEPTFMKKFSVPSGGDVSVHKSAMVFARGSVNFTVDGVRFLRAGGNALMLYDYNRDANIRHNHFEWTGDNAIVLFGQTDLIDGTAGNQPRRTLIEGNLIRELGIFCKQTSAVFQALSAQTIIRNNVMFNGPRAAICFNDGFGGQNLVENNVGFNWVRETGDHGVLNSWDRIPYLTDVSGVPSIVPVRSHTRKNLFVSNYNSDWPVDRDDGSSYWSDIGNVYVYGGSKYFLSYDETVASNLVLFPQMSRLPWSTCAFVTGFAKLRSGYSEYYMNNTCFMTDGVFYNFDSSCDAMNWKNLIPLFANNTLISMNKVFNVQCGSANFTMFKNWQQIGQDKNSKLLDQKSFSDSDIINAIVAWLR